MALALRLDGLGAGLASLFRRFRQRLAGPAAAARDTQKPSDRVGRNRTAPRQDRRQSAQPQQRRLLVESHTQQWDEGLGDRPAERSLQWCAVRLRQTEDEELHQPEPIGGGGGGAQLVQKHAQRRRGRQNPGRGLETDGDVQQPLQRLFPAGRGSAAADKHQQPRGIDSLHIVSAEGKLAKEHQCQAPLVRGGVWSRKQDRNTREQRAHRRGDLRLLLLAAPAQHRWMRAQHAGLARHHQTGGQPCPWPKVQRTSQRVECRGSGGGPNAPRRAEVTKGRKEGGLARRGAASHSRLDEVDDLVNEVTLFRLVARRHEPTGTPRRLPAHPGNAAPERLGEQDSALPLVVGPARFQLAQRALPRHVALLARPLGRCERRRSDRRNGGGRRHFLQ